VVFSKLIANLMVGKLSGRCLKIGLFQSYILNPMFMDLNRASDIWRSYNKIPLFLSNPYWSKTRLLNWHLNTLFPNYRNGMAVTIFKRFPLVFKPKVLQKTKWTSQSLFVLKTILIGRGFRFNRTLANSWK
jgi:hypothetical protein